MPSISTAPTLFCSAASPARFGRRIASALAIGLLVPTLALATMVRVQTPLGPVDIQLYDSAAPATVQNFLGYVNRGAYDGSFFHRSVPGFVVQGGGYTWNTDAGPLKIPAGPPVVNEFSATRSNLRGTVAMAKLGGDPNSATTEWFVNLADNAANLDNQNGGFTVFGKVTSTGLAVMDRIAALQIVNFSGCTPYGSAFSAVPVLSNPANCAATTPQTLTLAPTVRVLPATTSEIDRTLNYLESGLSGICRTGRHCAGVRLAQRHSLSLLRGHQLLRGRERRLPVLPGACDLGPDYVAGPVVRLPGAGHGGRVLSQPCRGPTRFQCTMRENENSPWSFTSTGITDFGPNLPCRISLLTGFSMRC